MRRHLATVLALTALLAACTQHAQDRSSPPPAPAPDRSVLTVDSVADLPDADPGDQRCRTADGRCTLRAAIEQANTGDRPSTIAFALPPAAGGPRPIRPRSALPTITQAVTIDGTTQDGYRANTAPWPRPLDGAPVVEIDGSLATSSPSVDGLTLGHGAGGSQVRGLVIGRFSGTAIRLAGARGAAVRGCYLGTDRTGLVDRGNAGSGIGHDAGTGSTGLRVGGPRPADRNVISANDDNAAYPLSGWVIEGNYLGVGADGRTALGNGTGPGSSSGALSIDDADDVRVGGLAPGTGNVISSNHSYGIAPYKVRRLRIEGNLIGVAADGSTPAGNGSAGIILSLGTGVEIRGNRVMHNVVAGILVSSSQQTTIGGTAAGDRNVVSGNQRQNVAISSLDPATTGTRIEGNLIGPAPSGRIEPDLHNEVGVWILGVADQTTIGGTEPGSANVIAGNPVAGVAIGRLLGATTPLSEALVPQRTAVIGNAFSMPARADGSRGLAIDLFDGRDTSVPPDYFPDAFEGRGPGLPAALDPRLRFGDTPTPTVTTATRSGRRLTLTVSLPGAAGARYRIEVYGTPAGTAPGAQAILLGSFELGAPSGTGSLVLDVKATGTRSVRATATVIDRTSRSGLGSTSELSTPATVDG